MYMVHQNMASCFSRFKYSFDFVRALFVYKNNTSVPNYLKVTKSDKNWIRHLRISHNAPYLPPPPHPPAKFCIRIVFNFFWDSCNTQEKWKTKVMQNLGEKIRCIMGDVQVAYGKFVLRFFSVESSWVWTIILQLSWRRLVILCNWTVLFDDVTHF